MNETPETFAKVIEAWPSRAALARDLTAVGYPTSDVRVRVWAHRAAIPEAAWPHLARAARRRGLVGLGLKALRRIARNP